MPSFAINCIGHSGQRSYTEYIFRVRHSSGFEWTVSRRYQELMDLHEKLCAVFGDKDLPVFPPRTTGGMVSALFGGHRPGSQPEVVKERERGFQRYFDGLCDRQDVVSTAVFQAALAVVPPEAISHLRVQGWLLPTEAGQGLTALLDIRPEAPVADSCAVAQSYHVTASLVFREDGSNDELCPVSDVLQPAQGRATLARVDGLKPGAQVEFQVSAANAVGRSPPVAIRAMVPPEASLAAPSVAATAAPSAAAAAPAALAAAQAPAVTAQAAPSADSQWLAAEEQRIRQEREKLEQWWAERQQEAERADAVREEQMAAFRAQRAAFDRQVSSRCGSGTASPEAASPALSPRGESKPYREADELQSLEEALQRKEEELANREERVGHSESQLQQERQELTRAKGKLAMVQAHIVSMIEGQQPRGHLEEHRIDDGATPLHSFAAGEAGEAGEAEDADRGGTVDGVWDADWVSPFKDKTPEAKGEVPREEDSPQRTPGAAEDDATASPHPQAAMSAAAAAAGS